MTQIEIFNYPAFRKNYSLEGTIYSIKLVYNSRSEEWFMSIEDEENETIISGIKLVTGIFLLTNKRFTESLPAGDFIVEKQSDNKNIVLNKETLGTEYILNYYTAQEVEDAS